MKHLIFITLFLFSSFIYSQELKCCKTIDEVKEILKGSWKNYFDIQETVYQFEFSDDSGIINEMIKTNVDGEFIMLECPTYIRIKKKENGFKIEYQYMVSSETFDIVSLNSDKFIIKNKNSEIEYVKIKD